MDYSLLLFIESRDSNAVEPVHALSKHEFIGDKYIYHIAIIDYLQEWNNSKKGERAIKTIFKGADGSKLSAIEPKEYMTRFIKFCNQVVFK